MPELFALTPRRLETFTVALAELGHEGRLGVSLPFLSPDEIGVLISQASRLPMRRAKTKAGAPGKEVSQDFDICFPAPRKGALDRLASLLEAAVARNDPFLDIEGFRLNDVAVQHYSKGSAGIGIHRDALKYMGLVFIIALAGASRLCLCEDREGNGSIPLDDSPGMLIILSAPGFNGRKGEAARPLHFVDQVSGGRLSIGLRFDSKSIA
jgi:hypothetical protein